MYCVCVCVSACERRSKTEREILCVRTRLCILLTWNQSCGGVIMILALFPEGSSLTAPGRHRKLPHFCLERQSSLRLPDMWMTLTEAGEMVRFCFSCSDVGWRVISISPSQGVMLSEREPGLSHTWMDSLYGSRPLKSVWVISCQHRGEQQQIGLLKQFSWTGRLLSVCLPTAWLLNPAFLLFTICPKSSRGLASRLPVNTRYWHEYCCSTQAVHGSLQEV